MSIGGAGANGTAFALMAGNSTTRQVFINSSVSLARSYGFDGLDLDWEFPSSWEEMASFALLVMDWRRLVEAISNNLDWINVMSYDLYAPKWSPNSTGPPAALYGSDQVISVDSGIRSWLQQGLPATKIVLGLPFYGESIFGKVLYAKVKGLGGYFAWHVGGDDNWTLSTTASQTWGA
ncbi:Class V chitinase [Linum perenne]